MQVQHTFVSLSSDSAKFQERGDCAVRAIAATCRVSYADAHAALAKAGRKPRKGTFSWQQDGALELLGFKRVLVGRPAACKTSTSAPAAIRKAHGLGSFLLYSRRHVAALVDGKVLDWTNGRRTRIITVHKVVPISPAAVVPEPKSAPKPAFKPAVPGFLPQPIKPAPAKGVDAFGSRLGTIQARINAVLSSKPKTMAQLLIEANVERRQHGYLRSLIARGKVVKVAAGYRLTV